MYVKSVAVESLVSVKENRVDKAMRVILSKSLEVPIVLFQSFAAIQQS